MKSFFSTVLSALIWAFLILLIFFVSSGIYQHFFSEKPYNGFFNIGYAVVVSGSMEPNVCVDDLIIYQEKETNEYEVGDVVVYEAYENGTPILITHRIIKVDDATFTTKGDANLVEDEPVNKNQVVGRIVWRFAYVGILVDFVKTPLGYATAALTIILLIALNIILTKNQKVS